MTSVGQLLNQGGQAVGIFGGLFKALKLAQQALLSLFQSMANMFGLPLSDFAGIIILLALVYMATNNLKLVVAAFILLVILGILGI